MPTISAGKLRKLQSLADAHGRFTMMAIDQRGSISAALAKLLGVAASEVPFEALVTVKAVITRALAPYASAVLTDPIYGYPYSGATIPGAVAVLLACEESGYQTAGPGGAERVSRIIPGWSVAQAKRVGADALKFLLYTHPDATEATRRHQESLVRRLGEECAEHQLPFLLELVTYSLEHAAASPEFAREKPGFVAESAREFSKPDYGVDLLKLEFPGNLKYTDEYSRGAFDGVTREPVCSLSDVEASLRKVDEASAVPWVLLSGGVGIEEFLVNLRLATAAGASGFLCGRAVWQSVLSHYPDEAAMKRVCLAESVFNWQRCVATAENALPWFDHRQYGGLEAIIPDPHAADWPRP